MKCCTSNVNPPSGFRQNDRGFRLSGGGRNPLVYPTTKPLLLDPTGGSGASQGVLRIADDGLSGIIMVAGMQELPPPQVYQVWLTDGDFQVLAGQMRVDPSGWGATTIYLEDPLTVFDTVEVTTQREDGLSLAPGIRVLEATIGEDSG